MPENRNTAAKDHHRVLAASASRNWGKIRAQSSSWQPQTSRGVVPCGRRHGSGVGTEVGSGEMVGVEVGEEVGG